MNLQYTVTHRSSTLCTICFPARTTMALFKCHPICQIRTGRLTFQAQKKVIKQSLGQWIASNWEAHTWQQGSSFNRQHWRKLPERKSFGPPAQCIEPSSTSTVISGSRDCRSGVAMVFESRPDHHREKVVHIVSSGLGCFCTDHSRMSLWSCVHEKLKSIISKSKYRYLKGGRTNDAKYFHHVLSVIKLSAK